MKVGGKIWIKACPNVFVFIALNHDFLVSQPNHFILVTERNSSFLACTACHVPSGQKQAKKHSIQMRSCGYVTRAERNALTCRWGGIFFLRESSDKVKILEQFLSCHCPLFWMEHMCNLTLTKQQTKYGVQLGEFAILLVHTACKKTMQKSRKGGLKRSCSITQRWSIAGSDFRPNLHWLFNFTNFLTKNIKKSQFGT